MFRILLILFIVAPAVELWGIIQVGKIIGGWNTLALVILTGFLGAWLAKRQGLQVLRLVQLQLSRGQMPAEAMLDGILVLAGGILLTSPGFFGDLLGLLLLIPYTRMIVRHLVKQWLWKQISTGRIYLFFRRR